MLRKKVLMLLLLFSHTVAANMSLWDHVVKMEQVVLSVEYNRRHLNVWKEDSHGYSRFYVTPLCTFETASVNCTEDEYSNDQRQVLTFHVKLWDLLTAETVKLALAQKNIETKASDILPLPMLLVRLGVNQDVTNKITVNKEWRSNQDQPNSIIFELYTQNKDFCDKMVNDAKSDPETFLARTKLFLEFTMVVGQQASRSLNITGLTFTKSNFFSNLDNQHSDNDGTIYLSSSDMNKLSREIYRTASSQEEITSTYVPSEQENFIVSELLDVIKDQTVQSNDLTKEEWNSVFWDDIFSRPDIQTEYFNEVLKYDEGEDLFKYNETKDNQFREKTYNEHHEEKEKKRLNNFGFSFKGFGFNSSGGKSEKHNSDDKNMHQIEGIDNNSMSKEELQKFLRKDNVIVQWSGEKFTPKNLLLYRLNTKTLKASGEIFYKRIVTTKYESVQTIEIRPEPQRQSNFDNTISPIYYEELKTQVNNLKQQLDNTTADFETRSTNIENNFANQIVAVNEVITNTANKAASDIDNTNQHITNVVNDVNAKRDALQNEYNILRGDHDSLRNEFNTLNSWSRNDFWNHVQGIYKHVDNIWGRTFKKGFPDYYIEEYKSRWGHYPG